MKSYGAPKKKEGKEGKFHSVLSIWLAKLWGEARQREISPRYIMQQLSLATPRLVYSLAAVWCSDSLLLTSCECCTTEIEVAVLDRGEYDILNLVDFIKLLGL